MLTALARNLANRANRVTLSGLPDEDGSATLVNVVDYDGNRYSVPLSKLDRKDADSIALDSPTPLDYDIDAYGAYVNKTAAPPTPDLDDPLVPSRWQQHDGYEFPFEEAITKRMGLAVSNISEKAAAAKESVVQYVDEALAALRAELPQYHNANPDGEAAPPASMVAEMTEPPAAPPAPAAACAA